MSLVDKFLEENKGNFSFDDDSSSDEESPSPNKQGQNPLKKSALLKTANNLEEGEVINQKEDEEDEEIDAFYQLSDIEGS